MIVVIYICFLIIVIDCIKMIDLLLLLIDEFSSFNKVFKFRVKREMGFVFKLL